MRRRTRAKRIKTRSLVFKNNATSISNRQKIGNVEREERFGEFEISLFRQPFWSERRSYGRRSSWARESLNCALKINKMYNENSLKKTLSREKSRIDGEKGERSMMEARGRGTPGRAICTKRGGAAKNMSDHLKAYTIRAGGAAPDRKSKRKRNGGKREIRSQCKRDGGCT